MIESSDEVTILSLCENDWVSLRTVIAPTHEIRGYTFSHETRCKGNIIAVLPFRIHNYEVEYLIRKEVTPCWGLDPVFSALTGGWEGGSFKADAVRELEEESGYAAEEKEFLTLNTCYGTKSTDTTFQLFAVNLTDKVQGKALGDGSKQDTEGTVHWMNKEDIIREVNDPIVLTMLTRLHCYYYI